MTDAPNAEIEQIARVAASSPEETIDRALEAVRDLLGLEVAYHTEFIGPRQVFQRLSHVEKSFGFHEGYTIATDETYCIRMIHGRIPHAVGDARGHPEVAGLAWTQAEDVGTYAGVPIVRSDGSVRGTLCAVSHEPDPTLADRDMRFLHVLARICSDTLERDEARTDADRLKDDFIARVSHELRTPLSSITGYLELLTQDELGGLSADGRRFLELCDRNARRMLRLVERLLAAAQAQAGRVRAPYGPVELGEVAADAVDTASPAAAERNVRINLKGGATPPVRGSADQLFQVVDNLLANAIRFSPEGGEVRVETAAAPGHVELTVSDTGPGIPAEQRDEVFGRFFAGGGAATAAGEGIGLGLWIVKSFVDAHGGEVAVVDGPVSGTTFRVSIPLALEGMPGGAGSARAKRPG